MKRSIWREVLLLAVVAWGAMAVTRGAAAALPSGPPEPARVEALAKLLPKTPRGVGRPIGDRQAWAEIGKGGELKKLIDAAAASLGKPLPELTDELYREFSVNGNRTRCQAVMGARHGRLAPLVLAECLENQGRFVGEIERVLLEICGEKTWVMPAHDSGLTNLEGTRITIDLGSSAVAWELATADYWLGEKLRPEVRQRVAQELQRRIFAPFEGMVNTGKPPMWWLRGTNNWNAVCLANVTGTAMAAIDSPDRRAFYAAAAEKYIECFLSGFTPDGYCSEGLGYWGYGFGHYVMLGETLFQQTDGKIDLFADPRVRPIAQFAWRMEILPGVYPALADCKVGVKPSATLMAYLDRKFGFGWAAPREPLLTLRETDDLVLLGLYGMPNSATRRPAQAAATEARPLRDFFPDGGVLIARPAAGAAGAMGVALKGGHNAEHHNHNDVGSFVVALGEGTPLVDPGSETYTRRTFSRDRYASGVLNSWGHPVPRVAGELQRTGQQAQAKILKTDFTDAADTLVLDLSSAYPVKTLTRLERTFVFAREGRGSLRVSDRVAFEKPESFGVALITFDPWRQLAPDRLAVGGKGEEVEVQIDTGGQAFTLKPEPIEEDVHGHKPPTRLGIDLDKPLREATVTLAIKPLAP